jgi:sulfite reductase (NADPH) flavoprotein alpha-component
MDVTTPYNKSYPFLASIKERYCLCSPESVKKIYHIVLDLKGSGIVYSVGDSIGVFSQHDPELVERTLQAMHAAGHELVTDKRTHQKTTLREILTSRANITSLSRKFLTEIALRQMDPSKKKRLDFLFEEAHKAALKEYLANHEIWDALQENTEVHFSLDEFVSLMMPMLPRFYSIASSMSVVGEEVHLTVADLAYTTNQHLRRGVCTYYLCELAPMHVPVIPVYVQPNHGFTLPADSSADLIMIGPGTGIAPYRGFMQERMLKKASGKHWLFFGERNRAHHFFYRDFWHELTAQDKLKLDLAFSRDQEHKIYVWHRMLEKSKELFQWLENGAYLYVCGDAHRMAKDVEATLLHIVKEEGAMDEASAKQYLKKLKTEQRYLRDVY